MSDIAQGGPSNAADYVPRASAAKWVDEAVTMVLIAPIPLALLGADGQVTLAMKALKEMPWWFVAGEFTMLGFVYGTRALRGAREFLSPFQPR